MKGEKRKIAVLGDVALDFYYFTKLSDEISVETNLPVNIISRYSYGAGGAGNLAVNIATLGAECDIYGICGDDIWADILKRSMNSAGVHTEHYIASPDFNTFVYHKIYTEDDQELPRYDLGGDNVYPTEALDTLLEQLEMNLDQYDELVINQQFSNSLHTPYFQEKLTRILEKSRISVWLDSREGINYPRCSYKINLSEAQAHSGKKTPEECVTALYEKYCAGDFRPSIVVTLGAEGAISYDGNAIGRVPGINATWTMDTVGAGDAFLSGLVYSLAGSASLSEALPFANASAAVSTKTLRATGHPTKSEIEELLQDPDYRAL
ncbi:MAG: carbohydrate kinase family protein [Eubacteriales bacterium]|nr:carbohydrate kinase family protein [Eubacteriales bacterium]